jgi:hypothetical protein
MQDRPCLCVFHTAPTYYSRQGGTTVDFCADADDLSEDRVSICSEKSPRLGRWVRDQLAHCRFTWVQSLYFNSTVCCDAVDAAVKSEKSPPTVWFALTSTEFERCVEYADLAPHHLRLNLLQNGLAVLERSSGSIPLADRSTLPTGQSSSVLPARRVSTQMTNSIGTSAAVAICLTAASTPNVTGARYRPDIEPVPHNGCDLAKFEANDLPGLARLVR